MVPGGRTDGFREAMTHHDVPSDRHTRPHPSTPIAAPFRRRYAPGARARAPLAGKVAVDLSFKSMDDFAPDAVAQQVGPLRELLALRAKLADLRSKLQGNDRLDEILQATVRDAERLAQLKTEIRGPEGETN